MRTADLGGFREALVALACDGDPLAARHRLVIVPTRAAAAHLLRSIEDRRLRAGGALILPEFVTPGELPERFASRLSRVMPAVDPARREVLLGLACREASADGAAPPFRLRPGLIAEILRFYDTLRRQRRDVDTFERLALGMLEPGAASDRGAERLVRQTRFLAASLRRFDARCADAGCVDEHLMRLAAIEQPAPDPWQHAVVAVGDRASDPYGLWAADWDLLARVPGLERLDVVVTDTVLAGTFHQRVHDLLPGIDEVRADEGGHRVAPLLRVPPSSPVNRRALAWTPRDREEEVAAFARWAREGVRTGEVGTLDSMALVVSQPLPYVYLTREVLRSAGVPCQTFDALPLAAEPYAAAVDQLFSAVVSSFARVPAIGLLRSPHFLFAPDGVPVEARSVAALDRALSEAAYLGELEALEQIVERWRQDDSGRDLTSRALPAAVALLDAARELAPLRVAAPVGEHLDRLVTFLRRHEHIPGPDDPLRARQLRARGAVMGMLSALRAAYLELDSAPAEFDQVASLIRRWIEAHTFAPRTGSEGVHLVDAESARFGDFTHVQLAGVVDGEWPERPRRNVFYSPSVLRELGWPAESERLDGARARFIDLLRLPTASLTLSAFALENDALVAASTLLDEIDRAGLEAVEDSSSARRIFEYEALGYDPPYLDALTPSVRTHAERRIAARSLDPGRYRGTTAAHAATTYSLSALERYQDCPFKFFAADMLHLDEPVEDETSMSPRVRGRFIHELFQRFYERWDAQAALRGSASTITTDRIDAARELFTEVATELLSRLPHAEAELERARLFGSAISTGMIDIVLGLEAARPAQVTERWLERRFEGQFMLGGNRAIHLKGVADRIDLLDGHRLRIIDYKTGSAPEVRRTLQVPVYALCAQEQLTARDGHPWSVDEATYVAFSGKRSVVPVVRSGAADAEAVLGAARERLLTVVAGVEAGEFPPRPHEERICSYCAYASVCRKDYVGDE